MTAPEPFDSPPDRFDAHGRRSAVPPGRAISRTFVVEPVESPLRRLLRTTAAQVQSPAAPAPQAAPPVRWRRPERHPESFDLTAGTETEDAPAADPAEVLLADPEVPTEGPDAGTAVDEDLPPILRAMLAERAAASEIATSEVVAGDVSPEVTADVEPERTAAVVPPEPAIRTREHPVVFVAPVAFDPPAAPPTPAALPTVADGAALAASLPFARLAAVACPEGEPEPPLCHPAAAVVSRVRPLSPLRALVRHGRPVRRAPLVAGVVAASVLVATLATAATAAWALTPAPTVGAKEAAASLQVSVAQDPPPILSLDQTATAAVAAVAMCDIPAVQTAISAPDPTAVIAAAGGAQAFHDAIVAGGAPCVSIGDPAWPWVVVNKQRPSSPIDYSPSSVVLPDGVASAVAGGLRPDAAAALSALVAASRAAGAGDIQIESAYRSYDTQTETHDEQVASAGSAADATSARAGYSEHQTGLAADLVACDGGCGSMDDFGGSVQGQWVAANAWQYGWVVRYESGTTAVTGYDPEPWHLRYIGPELATLYHDGGFHTLEEFWGLPAAPTY